MRAEREHHVRATEMQMRHENAARSNREQFASVNHGRPNVAASARPGEFRGHGVVAARAETGSRPEGGHRGDRPQERRDDRRGDRPVGNAPAASKSVGRNDRPANAVSRDSAASRPNSGHPNNNAREAREVRPVPDASRSRAQGPGETQGNARADRGPSQHSNAPHENAPHSNNKPEHGKPDRSKPEHP